MGAQCEVTTLPRGGYLVDSPIGYIQFGAPPETIKDTMRMPGGVPQIFVLTDEMFNSERGISVAEVEFPLYYNFYLRRRKTYLVCRREQYDQIMAVLQESLFGPVKMDIRQDCTPGLRRIINYDFLPEGYVPDIASEMAYFRAGRKLSDLLKVGFFEDNRFQIKGLTIEHVDGDGFRVLQGDSLLADVPGRVDYHARFKIGSRLPEPYHPPLFGITCLGPSHGFDPEENTSGFIVWLNHQGVMVDPPVNSTEWLESSNVNPKMIDSIILTHCHADHDAGTFQKIMEEGKVTVYTTHTVMMSFLRKYSALTNIAVNDLLKLFNFHPVRFGEPVFINNARFEMFYTLHSIPTIGFKMYFQDQSFVYTSDHNNDPGLHRSLFEQGVINADRYDELRNFPWASKIVYHESGVPPLHTPIAWLNNLTPDIQQRMVVYHIASRDFPDVTRLTLAKFGIENTLYFATRSPRFEEAHQALELLRKIDFLQNVSVSKVQEFLDLVQVEYYSKGDVIIRTGTPGDKFFIIQSGNISVDSGNLTERKIYGTYDYFGEVSLITDGPRVADVRAETDVVLYTLAKDAFLHFISGTEFERVLVRLTKVRTSETWNLLSSSRFFRNCTASQKTWLESMFVSDERDDGTVLIAQGRVPDRVWIIRSGTVNVRVQGQVVATLQTGESVGSIQGLYERTASEHEFVCEGRVSLFALERAGMVNFISNNPGILLKFIYSY